MVQHLRYLQLVKIGDTVCVHVRAVSGTVAFRDFAVEANSVRALLARSGAKSLLVDVDPGSSLTPEFVRGLVAILREARERGESCAFAGGGETFRLSLDGLGLSRVWPWFPTRQQAIATLHAATAAPPAPSRAPQAPAPPPVIDSPAPRAAATAPVVPAKPPARILPSDRTLPARELTLRSHHRLPILETSPVCAFLAGQIREATARHNFALWAWVIMPDHFHLLVHPRALNCDFLTYLEDIKTSFDAGAVDLIAENSPQLLKRLQTRTAGQVAYQFWQATTGQNRTVDFSRPVRPLINHFHDNPVRKGLIDDPTQWRWSSAGWFAGAPLNDLQPDPVPPELLGP